MKLVFRIIFTKNKNQKNLNYQYKTEHVNDLPNKSGFLGAKLGGKNEGEDFGGKHFKNKSNYRNNLKLISPHFKINDILVVKST